MFSAEKKVPAEQPKAEVKAEEVIAKPKEESPLKGLSLEERLEVLQDKKAEIEILNQKRQEYYINAKNLEEKINSLGISEAEKNNLRAEIEGEGGEIAQTIDDIRNKYGLQPTAVEIYSTRFNMIAAEIDRIKENMASHHREALKVINNYFPTGIPKVIDIYDKNYKYFTEYLKEKFGDLDVIQEFLIRTRTQAPDFETQAANALSNLKTTLEAERDEKTTYKTPGELQDAVKRLDRLSSILDDIDMELRDAKNKEGRFETDKDKKYF
jgi:hypothetical protein